MTLEEGLDAPNLSSHHGHHHHHHHLMDWLEDSISFLPTFLNDPYAVAEEIVPCEWWVQDQNQSLTAAAAVAAVAAAPPIPIVTAKPEPLPETPKAELPKKRKLAARQTAVEYEEDRKPHVNNGSKKGQGKGSILNSGSGGGGCAGKEVRWAEQLLNPLAAAIDAANLSRVQHLIYVLQELASPTGDANHRLAFYGLQALSRHFSSSISSPLTYASTDPRLFRSALIKFHEVSAWFAFPNCLANAAILQAAMGGRGGPVRCGNLQVVDVGVSHGLQWPTLMEALTRRAAGLMGQGMVKLTVVETGSGGPFGSAPPGYDFVPQLMRYAKSIDLNLRVDRGDVGRGPGKEIVVVCLQFRAGCVGLGFWKAVREMEPDLVVLTEMEEGKGGGGEGDRGFGRRAEMLWRFLESTSVAFKGKDSEERRVVEGEAARLLEEELDEGEGKGGERWKERMEGEGFKEEGFGEEALEAGRALLKKYDGNWEMKIGADGAVGLSWKGQTVSFCSLWKPAYKATAGVLAGGGRRH